MDTNCPKCGGPSTLGLTVGFRFAETPAMKEIITQAYVCAGGCTQKVPYPGEADGGYSDWDLEFVIIDGKKYVCRPTASEFA